MTDVRVHDVVLAGARLVLGGYLAAHGAQKLFGTFDGPGLEACGKGFEQLGLTPGRPMAVLAGASELGGGLLIAVGAAHPAGPLAVAGTMAVASATHRGRGPFNSDGGYELPLANLVAAAALGVAGPGRFRLGGTLPGLLTAAGALAGGAMAAVSIVRIRAAQRAALAERG
jgi:putative oxidoreductase